RARSRRSHDSPATWRRVFEAWPHGAGRGGAGKAGIGMAQGAAGGPRRRQDRRTRGEAVADQAPRGAKGLHPRRQASLSRMREVKVPRFAKINSRLDILGKRPAGYHELRTLFHSISLRDDLVLRGSRQPGIALTIKGNDHFPPEPLEKNLVYRAVDALRQ